MSDTGHTVIVWNDAKVVLRYACSVQEGVSIADKIRDELHDDDDDDPRWQVAPGFLAVSADGCVISEPIR